MSTLWGIQDCALNSFQFTICSFQFDRMSVAFAIYYWFKSVIGFTTIVLESLLVEQKSYVWYFIAIGAFGVFAWLLFLLGFKIDPKTENPENEDESANKGDYQAAIQEEEHHTDSSEKKVDNHESGPNTPLMEALRDTLVDDLRHEAER